MMARQSMLDGMLPSEVTQHPHAGLDVGFGNMRYMSVSLDKDKRVAVFQFRLEGLD